MVVVGKELIFAVWEVEWSEFQVIGMVLHHQPLQRHGVPEYHTLVFRTYRLYSFLHVVEGNDFLGPSVINQFMVTETAFMYNDGVVGQVLTRLGMDSLTFWGYQTMGEYLYNGFSV